MSGSVSSPSSSGSISSVHAETPRKTRQQSHRARQAAAAEEAPGRRAAAMTALQKQEQKDTGPGNVEPFSARPVLPPVPASALSPPRRRVRGRSGEGLEGKGLRRRGASYHALFPGIGRGRRGLGGGSASLLCFKNRELRSSGRIGSYA